MLNDRQIPKLPKGRHSDARGLYLVVSASAARKWVYRYRMDGKSHDLGRGSYTQISLKQAHQQRDHHESERLQGQNPIALKRARREAAQEARDRINAELATRTEEEQEAAKCLSMGRVWTTLFYVPSPIDINLERLTIRK